MFFDAFWPLRWTELFQDREGEMPLNPSSRCCVPWEPRMAVKNKKTTTGDCRSCVIFPFTNRFFFFFCMVAFLLREDDERADCVN